MRVYEIASEKILIHSAQRRSRSARPPIHLMHQYFFNAITTLRLQTLGQPVLTRGYVEVWRRIGRSPEGDRPLSRKALT